MSLAACLEREGIDNDILETNVPGFDLASFTLSPQKTQRAFQDIEWENVPTKMFSWSFSADKRGVNKNLKLPFVVIV